MYSVKVVAFVLRLCLNLEAILHCACCLTLISASVEVFSHQCHNGPSFLAHCQCRASNFCRASLIYFFAREVLQFRALRIFRSRRASFLSLKFPSVSKPAGKVAIKKLKKISGKRDAFDLLMKSEKTLSF